MFEFKFCSISSECLPTPVLPKIEVPPRYIVPQITDLKQRKLSYFCYLDFFLGGGAWGPEGVYHQKSSDMSILGFSIVGISKMISIFILGYPQPLQGHPFEGGVGGLFLF